MTDVPEEIYEKFEDEMSHAAALSRGWSVDDYMRHFYSQRMVVRKAGTEAVSREFNKRFGFEETLPIDVAVKRAAQAHGKQAVIEHLRGSEQTLKVEQEEKEDQLAHLYAMKLATQNEHIRLRPRPFATGNVRLMAHEVLEQIRSLKRHHLLFPMRSEEETPSWEDDKKFLDGTYREIERAQKFDLRSICEEDIEPNAAFADELDAAGLLRLPFETVWFEWDIEPGFTIGALGLDHPDRPVFTGFVRVPRFGWAQWRNNNGLDVIEEHATRFTRAAVVILTSISAEKTAVEPPAALNKKRAIADKPPLFSHTVVEIRGVQLSNKTGEVLGHDRRSPRMHWRRGHLRRYRKNGEVYRVTAIAPMLVGLAALGRIDHDYMMGKVKLKTPELPAYPP